MPDPRPRSGQQPEEPTAEELREIKRHLEFLRNLDEVEVLPLEEDVEGEEADDAKE